MLNIVYMVGIFDTIVIMALGIYAAALVLTGKESDLFWNRVFPACAILIGTSIAAGIVMAITRGITGA